MGECVGSDECVDDLGGGMSGVVEGGGGWRGEGEGGCEDAALSQKDHVSSLVSPASQSASFDALVGEGVGFDVCVDDLGGGVCGVEEGGGVWRGVGEGGCEDAALSQKDNDVLLSDPALSISLRQLKQLSPIIPYLEVPSMEEFLPTFLGHLDLSMSHSFGVDFWKSKRAGAWRDVRHDVSASLQVALDEPTPLNIFQACHDLVFAPSRFLHYVEFVRSKPKPLSENIDTANVIAAAKSIAKGQTSKALKILTGPGAAPHTDDQLLRTSALFPDRTTPVFAFHQWNTKDLTMDQNFILKKINKMIAASEPDSPDVFGWDPVLFRDPEASETFIPVLCRFLCSFISWSHAPSICSQFFASSSLISLFKLTEAEREKALLKAKLGTRPIGSESIFGKLMDRQVLDSKEGKNFKSFLRPVQRAFDSRGITSISAAALGALKQGYAIGKGDIENAFQCICRMTALSNIHEVEPALASYLSRTLCQLIPMFTRNVNGQIVVIWSSSGAPQGSVPGTLVYTAGVMKIYDILKTEFPSFFLSSATDDLFQFFKPELDTHDDWQEQFTLFAKFLHRYEELARTQCSLKQNISKGAVVLPNNAPLPSEEVLALFPPGFKFHHVSAHLIPPEVPFSDRTDGLVICGAPVGSDFFIDAFMKWKTDVAISKLHTINRLAQTDSIPTPRHVAFKLLATCGSKMMSFAATTVPPQFATDHLKRFDNEVRAVFFKILYPAQTDCTGVRCNRSFHRATLPVGQGGLGLLRSSISAAALWWSNLRVIQADPSINGFLGGLDPFVPEALNYIKSHVGGEDSVSWLNLAPLFLPPEVYGQAPEPPPKSLLKVLLIAVSKFQCQLVKDKFAPSKVSSDGTLTKSDVIAFNSRSSLNIVFNNKGLRNISNDHFVKLICVYLGLPPTCDNGNPQVIEGFDYPVASCMSIHGKQPTSFLDANADHHSGSCPSAALAVNRRHNNLTTVLAKFAQEAGAVTSREPSSYNLLQGQLSIAQCKKIFPKNVPSAYKKQAKAILDLLAQPSVDRAKVDTLVAALPPLDPANSAALRLDLAVENLSNGKIFLIDGSFIHTSCANYRDAEFKAVVKRVEQADLVSKRQAMDPRAWEPSPAIADKVKIKVTKHAPLMQIIHKFESEHIMQGSHSFVPFVVSSLGELSNEAFGFREELISMFRHKVTSGAHPVFPLSPAQAVADFRSRFTLALMQVPALGLASITCTAGKPFRNYPIACSHPFAVH